MALRIPLSSADFKDRVAAQIRRKLALQRIPDYINSLEVPPCLHNRPGLAFHDFKAPFRPTSAPVAVASWAPQL